MTNLYLIRIEILVLILLDSIFIQRQRKLRIILGKTK